MIMIIDVLLTYTNYRIKVALDELELERNIKIKQIEYGSRRSAALVAAMLQYCVGPSPNSSPG